MANKPLTYRIYGDLANAVASFSPVHLGRPKTTDSPKSHFIVVTLPTEIKDITAGNTDFSLKTYGYYDIYVKAKTDSTMNVNAQTTLTAKVEALFPIKGEVMVASKPTLRFMGYDGYGFHVTRVIFDIRTLININNL